MLIRWNCDDDRNLSCSGEVGLLMGMAGTYPTIIDGLRSPSARVSGLVYFGRMLDKIRLQAAGKLPEGWQAARGTANPGSFDARCCRFLRVDYADLETETLKGGSDEELLEWACVGYVRKSLED